MSCPDNALLEAYPNIYECGFTIVDEYTKVSGTANSTRHIVTGKQIGRAHV